ncbi:MAG: hypothetical protein LBT21_04290 [Oscillospiraceae bacterium]|jgi:hypothetical protein|nr:hypothetical protein [Oscillospiraceae bacterium]
MQKMKHADWRNFFFNVAVEYCRKNNLSVEKLSNQVLAYADGISAAFADPESNDVLPDGLTNDMETRLKPTLLVKLTPQGLLIEETPHTRTYLAA